MKGVVALAFLFAVAGGVSGALIDPDLWWHLVVGRWILAHGTIPTTEIWNSFAVGEPWRAYSWLPEVLFAAVDRWGGGLTGLAILQLVSVGGVVGVVWLVLRALARDGYLAALILLLVVGSLVDHVTLRPQLFVWGYFAVALLLAERVRGEGFTMRSALALVALFAVWANTQFTSVIGLVGIACWLLPERRLKDAALALGSAFVGTLITPYLGGEWLTLVAKGSHPLAFSAIAEFQPITVLHYPTGFIVVLAIFVGALVAQGGGVGSLGRAIGGLGFVLVGLAIVKFLPFAGIYLGALVAREWRDGGAKRLGNLGEGVERLRDGVAWLPLSGLAFLLLAYGAVRVSELVALPLNRLMVPWVLAERIITDPYPRPVVSDFGRGGLLMYFFADERGVPRETVAIDGRTNVMPRRVWEAYIEAEQGSERYHEFLTLTGANTLLWRIESPLTTILKVSGEWCESLRSTDGRTGFVLLVRRGQGGDELCAGAGA